MNPTTILATTILALILLVPLLMWGMAHGLGAYWISP